MQKTHIAAAALALTTLLPAAALACPDWAQSGISNLGTLGGDYLYTPRAYSVTAGGGTDLSACPMPGVGYVVQAPDFEFTLDNSGGYSRLEISVAGDCDTVLLVNDANGQWHFNDDTYGADPEINVAGAPSGTYDVWVGTYGPNACNAQLELETW